VAFDARPCVGTGTFDVHAELCDDDLDAHGPVSQSHRLAQRVGWVLTIGTITSTSRCRSESLEDDVGFDARVGHDPERIEQLGRGVGQHRFAGRLHQDRR
jgi:hypothetical protein